MPTDEVYKCHWIFTFIAEHQLESVNENQRKLADLEDGIKCFPPEEKLFRLGKSCDENKVRVDDDVNSCVDEPKEC